MVFETLAYLLCDLITYVLDMSVQCSATEDYIQTTIVTDFNRTSYRLVLHLNTHS